MTKVEEQELRDLMAREYPKDAFTLALEDLGRLGVGMVGVWSMFPDDYPLAPVAA